MQQLELTLVKGTAETKSIVAVNACVVAGWAGRDEAAVRKHVHELEELGVPAPSTTPLFYRVSAARLSTAPTIEVLGDESSGEIECVILAHGDELWVGIGSDHTDRGFERTSVAASKQLCEKPVGTTFWAYADVAAHWDQLALTSYIREGGREVLYQEFTAGSLLAPETLIERHAGGRLANGTLMFCGTGAAIGGVRPSRHFAMRLEDPVKRRRLAHAYAAEKLEIVS